MGATVYSEEGYFVVIAHTHTHTHYSIRSFSFSFLFLLLMYFCFFFLFSPSSLLFPNYNRLVLHCGSILIFLIMIILSQEVNVFILVVA